MRNQILTILFSLLFCFPFAPVEAKKTPLEDNGVSIVTINKKIQCNGEVPGKLTEKKGTFFFEEYRAIFKRKKRKLKRRFSGSLLKKKKKKLNKKLKNYRAQCSAIDQPQQPTNPTPLPLPPSNPDSELPPVGEAPPLTNTNKTDITMYGAIEVDSVTNRGVAVVQGPGISLLVAVNEVGTGDAVGKIYQVSEDRNSVTLLLTLNSGTRIDDMAYHRGTNKLLVTGSFGGLLIADPTSTKIQTPLPFSDLSEGNGNKDGGKTKGVFSSITGTIAVLRAKNIIFMDNNGVELMRTVIGRTYVNDIALSHDASQLYVVGYRNASRNGVPVQVPFFYVYTPQTMQRVMTLWDFDAQILGNDMADGRLYHVTVSPRGNVYVAGESAGGNSVFRWNGIDLSSQTVVNTDKYHHAFNTSSNHITYYAQVDIPGQKVLRGQFALVRLSKEKGEKGNTVRIGDGNLFVDEWDTLYLVGKCFGSLPNRDGISHNGVTVSGYGGGDPYILVVSADLQQRYRWVSLGGIHKSKGTTESVTVHNGEILAVGTLEEGSVGTTLHAKYPKAFIVSADGYR